MIIQPLLIAISVSMDAFAVAIGKGLAATRIRPLDALKTALWFGGFQALFPLLGYIGASALNNYVSAFDHWIIFSLLALIGGNMIREALREGEANKHETPQFSWRHMMPLAIACSIDALAVGVSFAFLQFSVPFAIGVIGIVTAAFAAAGLYLGRVVGLRWQKPAQIAGGIVLILIGTNILLEHLGIIG
ncbi:manganese efflux pump MntP [Bifidobacterium subtile]|jgi:putative Mn2+ efflux pump MntP|nr:manganese efflux pump MntP family protein [Bifidobacterium subtile]QOL36103.1 manganese efflux pump [Bifidobacterium subtile]